jgi:XTP/dITP diphosphohydrolase
VVLASSNPGKLAEYRQLAQGAPIEMEMLPHFGAIPVFEESAPTFAENSAGKALYYSQHTDEIVLSDDSGLLVRALGDAPGVHSARYAGPNATGEERVAKLLREMKGKEDRAARFVCVTALAQRGRAIAVVSDSAEGTITRKPRGSGGFGYDPVFFFPPAARTFAEISQAEKNKYSHRGKAFQKILSLLVAPDSLPLFHPSRI